MSGEESAFESVWLCQNKGMHWLLETVVSPTAFYNFACNLESWYLFGHHTETICVCVFLGHVRFYNVDELLCICWHMCDVCEANHIEASLF